MMPRLRASLLIIGMFMISAVPAHADVDRNHIVLLGASITEAWNILDIRSRIPGFPAQVTPRLLYEFDKSPLVTEVLKAPNRPRAVIIKECGAYFPGDQARYQNLVMRWVGQLRTAGIEPVLATTLPVTASQPFSIRIKQLIKRYILFRSDYVDNEARLKVIWSYNDWVRSYALREKIKVLDLESAVVAPSAPRVLPDEFTSGDGLHLNARAYRQLDTAMMGLAQSLAGGR